MICTEIGYDRTAPIWVKDNLLCLYAHDVWNESIWLIQKTANWKWLRKECTSTF